MRSLSWLAHHLQWYQHITIIHFFWLKQIQQLIVDPLKAAMTKSQELQPFVPVVCQGMLSPMTLPLASVCDRTDVTSSHELQLAAAVAKPGVPSGMSSGMTLSLANVCGRNSQDPQLAGQWMTPLEKKAKPVVPAITEKASPMQE